MKENTIIIRLEGGIRKNLLALDIKSLLFEFQEREIYSRYPELSVFDEEYIMVVFTKLYSATRDDTLIYSLEEGQFGSPTVSERQLDYARWRKKFFKGFPRKEKLKCLSSIYKMEEDCFTSWESEVFRHLMKQKAESFLEFLYDGDETPYSLIKMENACLTKEENLLIQTIEEFKLWKILLKDLDYVMTVM